MKTRKDKINFLNGILTGKRKLTELLPDTIIVSIVTIHPDGTKEYEYEGKKYTEEEHIKLTKNGPAIDVLKCNEPETRINITRKVITGPNGRD